MGRFTPGPWSQEHRLMGTGGYSTEVFDTDGELIATVAWYPIKTDYGFTTNRDANARLIAAAPDLLSALEQLIDDMRDGHCVCEQAKQEAIAAIAKATGK